jgi:hypothetical protein
VTYEKGKSTIVCKLNEAMQHEDKMLVVAVTITKKMMMEMLRAKRF